MLLVHGTCVDLDGRGILLRGPSGSGKSDLALRLIDSGARLVADDQVVVGTSEAQDMARRLGREEGLLVGVSAGANVAAAVQLARTLPPGSVVVTVLCDAGSRYLSDDFWAGEPD